MKSELYFSKVFLAAEWKIVWLDKSRSNKPRERQDMMVAWKNQQDLLVD